MEKPITAQEYRRMLATTVTVDGQEKELGVAFDSCTQAFGRALTYLALTPEMQSGMRDVTIGALRPELQQSNQALKEIAAFGRRINGFATQMWVAAKEDKMKVRNDYDIFTTTETGELAATRAVVRDMVLVAADLFDPDSARGATRRSILEATYRTLELGDFAKDLANLDRTRAYAEVGLTESEALKIVANVHTRGFHERLTGFSGAGQLGDAARILEEGRGPEKF
jgi:hypothetical protein